MMKRKVRAQCLFLSQGKREVQEDYALSVAEKSIFAMSDGFGGGVAGAIASKTACEAMRGFLEKEAGDLEATLPFVLRSYYSLAGNVLFNAIVHANRKVCELNQGKNVHEKGGASILGGFMDGDLLALANVGSCTAWLIRGGNATEIVVPRTYGRLVDPFFDGPMRERQAPLTALGIGGDVEPEIFECRVEDGDVVVMMSDGVEALERGLIFESTAIGAQVLENEMKKMKFDDNASVLAIFF